MTSIKVELEGWKELEQKMASLSKAAAANIAKDAVDEGAAEIQFYAQLNALHGFRRNQHGTLRNSITVVESRKTASGAEAKIGPGVIYGRIQEMGGTIRPIRAKVLRFQIDGQWRSAKQVTLPARPYLQPAVEQHVGDISRVMKEAIADGIAESI